jgi:hypothetical protein
MILGREVDGKKIRPESVGIGRDGTIAVVDGAEHRLLVLGEAGGNVEIVDRGRLGLPANARLGPVSVDGTGRVVLGVPDKGLVLRLSLRA